ncbi:MAG: thiamine pyrophosphate-dependent enzyme [Thermoleophilia bacterium]
MTDATDDLGIEQYLHSDRFPHIWCPGCGLGTVTAAFLRAALALGLRKDRTVVVGGIGCSSRAVGYLDFGTVHSIHGRALAFATGIKMAHPEFTVIVLTGDGDGAAIGGNHLIHAARRNIDITTILFNNMIYGMTGGQASPQTGPGHQATTAPFGVEEPAFDLCRLVEAAGATYVARGTSFGVRQLERLIRGGIEHKGFSFIEAVTQCPTEFGKRNAPKSPVAMLEDFKARTVTVKEAKSMTPEEREGRLVAGLLHKDEQVPELSASYRAMLARLRERRERDGREGA